MVLTECVSVGTSRQPNNKALKAMKKEALTDINNALKGTDSSSGESTGTEG